MAGPNLLSGHWTGDGWAVLVDKSFDSERSLLTRRITTYRRVGKLYRRSEETHVVRLYELASLRDALASAGFVTKPLRAFGDYCLRGGHFAILARKP